MADDLSPDNTDLVGLTHEQALLEVRKLREENARRRVAAKGADPVITDLETKLSGYQKQDAERVEKERITAEAEALKRGEHEKVIAEKEAEILSERKASKDKERLLRDRLMERELKVHLADSIDADVCAKLIDKKMISFDPETYEISGVDAAVALLREAKPHFFGAAKPTGTNVAGRGATPGGSKVSSNLMDQEGTLDSLVGQYR